MDKNKGRYQIRKKSFVSIWKYHSYDGCFWFFFIEYKNWIVLILEDKRIIDMNIDTMQYLDRYISLNFIFLFCWFVMILTFQILCFLFACLDWLKGFGFIHSFLHFFLIVTHKMRFVFEELEDFWYLLVNFYDFKFYFWHHFWWDFVINFEFDLFLQVIFVFRYQFWFDFHCCLIICFDF